MKNKNHTATTSSLPKKNKNHNATAKKPAREIEDGWRQMGPMIIQPIHSASHTPVLSLSGNGRVLAVVAANHNTNDTAENNNNNDKNNNTNTTNPTLYQGMVFAWNGTAWNPLGQPLSGGGPSSSVSTLVLSANAQVVATVSQQKKQKTTLQPSHADDDGKSVIHVWSWNKSRDSWEPLGTNSSLASMCAQQVDDKTPKQYSTNTTADSCACSKKVRLALSGDGHVLAVGTPHPQKVQQGQGPRGSVRVYSYQTHDNQWYPQGEPLVAASMHFIWKEENDTATGHIYRDDTLTSFGSAVALSRDGTRLTVGAPFHDWNLGLVRTYRYDMGSSDKNNNPVDQQQPWVPMGRDWIGRCHGCQLGNKVHVFSSSSLVEGQPGTMVAAEEHGAGHPKVAVWNDSETSIRTSDKTRNKSDTIDLWTNTSMATIMDKQRPMNSFALSALGTTMAMLSSTEHGPAVAIISYHSNL